MSRSWDVAVGRSLLTGAGHVSGGGGCWLDDGDLLAWDGLVLDMLAVWPLKRAVGRRIEARSGIRGGILCD